MPRWHATAHWPALIARRTAGQLHRDVACVLTSKLSYDTRRGWNAPTRSTSVVQYCNAFSVSPRVTALPSETDCRPYQQLALCSAGGVRADRSASICRARSASPLNDNRAALTQRSWRCGWSAGVSFTVSTAKSAACHDWQGHRRARAGWLAARRAFEAWAEDGAVRTDRRLQLPVAGAERTDGGSGVMQCGGCEQWMGEADPPSRVENARARRRQWRWSVLAHHRCKIRRASAAIAASASTTSGASC